MMLMFVKILRAHETFWRNYPYCDCCMFMMSAFLIGILKVLLVIVILSGMVMLLLGIGIMAHTAEDTDDTQTARMREEIRERSDVIGRHSVFRSFIGKSRARTGRRD